VAVFLPPCGSTPCYSWASISPLRAESLLRRVSLFFLNHPGLVCSRRVFQSFSIAQTNEQIFSFVAFPLGFSLACRVLIAFCSSVSSHRDARRPQLFPTRWSGLCFVVFSGLMVDHYGSALPPLPTRSVILLWFGGYALEGWKYCFLSVSQPDSYLSFYWHFSPTGDEFVHLCPFLPPVRFFGLASGCLFANISAAPLLSHVNRVKNFASLLAFPLTTRFSFRFFFSPFSGELAGFSPDGFSL